MSAGFDNLASGGFDQLSQKAVWSLLEVLKIDAGKFARAIGVADALLVDAEKAETGSEAGRRAIQPGLARQADWLVETLDSMALPMALKSALRYQSAVKDIELPRPAQELRTQLREVIERMHDELDHVSLYRMCPGYAGYYEPSGPLFGDAVDRAFPECAVDIEEAGKCLAVGRSTASVFHLMRVMEAATRKLCKHHGRDNLQREWGKLISDLDADIQKMEAGERRNRWSEAKSNLYDVKQAWRNDTMHPNRTYTEDQADDIFRKVRSFMITLSGLISSSE